MQTGREHHVLRWLAPAVSNGPPIMEAATNGKSQFLRGGGENGNDHPWLEVTDEDGKKRLLTPQRVRTRDAAVVLMRTKLDFMSVHYDTCIRLITSILR